MTEPVIRDIDPTKLTLDGRLQPREGVKPSKLRDLRDLCRAKIPFADPVECVLVGSGEGAQILVCDGFGRTTAAQMEHLEAVKCRVRPGDWEDAVRLAAGANRQHLGEPRSSDDIRRACWMLFDHIAGSTAWTHRRIGELVGVAHTTAAKYLAEWKAANKPINDAESLESTPSESDGECEAPSVTPEFLAAADIEADTPIRTPDKPKPTGVGPVGQVAAAPTGCVRGTIGNRPPDDDAYERAEREGMDMDEAGLDAEDEIDERIVELPIYGKMPTKDGRRLVAAAARLYYRVNEAFAEAEDSSAVGGLVESVGHALNRREGGPRDWKLCLGCNGHGCEACGPGFFS